MQNILIVEDDNNFLAALSIGMTAAGHQVHTARTGKEALQIMETQECHAAVINMHLPRVTGLDVLALIRRRRDEMPCIIMVGSYDIDLIRPAFDCPNVEVLFKPVAAFDVAIIAEHMMRQYP